MAKFVKGQSGNPGGRPKRDWSWAIVLAQAVEEADKNGQPIKNIIARVLVRETLKGNILAIKELMNRMDGLPKQDIKMAGDVNISFHESLKQK